MLQTVQGEYARRGKPLGKTGWTVVEVHRFMQAHLSRKTTGDDIGTRAHELPAKSESGEGAPMPEFVLQYEKKHPPSKQQKRAPEPEPGKDGEPFPTTNYKLKASTTRQPWMLHHPNVEQMIELPTLPLTVKYMIYTSKDGDCLWRTDQDDQPQFCRDIFEQVLKKPTTATGVSAGSPTLPGQRVRSGEV